MLHLPKDRPSDISRPLEALIPLIQDTIGEARRIQSDLRPPLLDDLGIVPTLSWFCRRVETIYSNIAVKPSITLCEDELPDHLKIVLFRVIQEALNNIGKHTGPTRCISGCKKSTVPSNWVSEIMGKDSIRKVCPPGRFPKKAWGSPA